MPADSTNKRSARKTTRADRASPDFACGIVHLKAEKQPRQRQEGWTAESGPSCNPLCRQTVYIRTEAMPQDEPGRRNFHLPTLAESGGISRPVLGGAAVSGRITSRALQLLDLRNDRAGIRTQDLRILAPASANGRQIMRVFEGPPLTSASQRQSALSPLSSPRTSKLFYSYLSSSAWKRGWSRRGS